MDAIGTLKKEFSRRKQQNPGYSLRAFARAIGASPATLSQVLSAKRPLTPKQAIGFAERLELSPRQRRDFIASSVDLRSASTAAAPFWTTANLDHEKFRLIADWYHFAILALAGLPPFVREVAEGDERSIARGISRALGIPVSTAREALVRLRLLGILHPEGFRQIGSPLHVTSDIPSEAMRAHHRQFLGIAVRRLDELPPAAREFHTLTFPADPRKLPRLKELIDRFLTEVNQELDGDDSAVFALSLQLYPLTPEFGAGTNSGKDSRSGNRLKKDRDL